MPIYRYLLFLCGQIGMMSLARFLYQWILKFGNQKNSEIPLFDPILLGSAFVAFRIFDGLSDPIAGKITDSWKRRGFQRRTLLLFTFFLAPIGLAITFSCNHNLPQPANWFILLIGLLIFFIGSTFYAIPYWSLIDDYSQNNNNIRSKLSGLLGLGIVIGSGIGNGASGFLINSYGYGKTGIFFAFGSILLMALPYWASPTKRSTEHQPKLSKHKTDSLWSGIISALKHRRFLALIALFGGSQMSFAIMTAAAPFIAQDLLGGSEQDSAALMGPLIGAAIPFFFFVPKIQMKFGWLNCMLWASIALAVVYLCSGLLGNDLIFSPLATAAFVFGMGGPMVAVLLGVEAEGVVDCAKSNSKTNSVGTYWGAFNLVVKILNGIAVFMASILISLQSQWGVIAVRSMSFLAGLCLILGVVIYYLLRPNKKTNEKESITN